MNQDTRDIFILAVEEAYKAEISQLFGVLVDGYSGADAGQGTIQDAQVRFGNGVAVLTQAREWALKTLD